MSRSTTLRSNRARWIAGSAVALAATGVVGSLQTSTAVAAAAPEVFAGFDDIDFLSGTSPRTNTVTVPAGSYAITAKAFARGGPLTDVNCRLQAGGSFDDSTVTVSSSTSASLALNVVNTFASSSSIVLTCKNISTAGNTEMRFIKIVATRVNGLSNVSM